MARTRPGQACIGRARAIGAAALAAVVVLAGCGIGTIDGDTGGIPAPPTSALDASTDPSIPDARRGDPSPIDAAPGKTDASVVDAAPAKPDAGVVDAGKADAGAADARTPGMDCRDAATWPAAWTAYEDAVVVLINQHRAAGATCGGEARPPVPALTVDAHLREAARCHSLDMAVQGYFDHTSKDGRSPWQRIAQAGYTGSPTAENIVAGTATAADAVRVWMGSTGHCNNIMGAASKETGLGYAFVAGSPYGHYATETFGTR